MEIEGIGTVAFMKRRGARSVRLSIAHSGEVKVTLPAWAPYQVGIEFVRTKTAWIQEQRPQNTLLQPKQRVGKVHYLQFVRGTGDSVTTRLVGNEIRILMPNGYAFAAPAVQAAAQKAAVRALKKEARGLLPQRLKLLADQNDFQFKTISVKQLKGRWGSCSEQKDIILNCYLMELPWHLIDYVLFHELVHTRIMAHGPVFWAEVGRYVQDLPAVRKEMKLRKPAL